MPARLARRSSHTGPVDARPRPHGQHGPSHPRRAARLALSLLALSLGACTYPGRSLGSMPVERARERHVRALPATLDARIEEGSVVLTRLPLTCTASEDVTYVETEVRRRRRWSPGARVVIGALSLAAAGLLTAGVLLRVDDDPHLLDLGCTESMPCDPISAPNLLFGLGSALSAPALASSLVNLRREQVPGQERVQRVERGAAECGDTQPGPGRVQLGGRALGALDEEGALRVRLGELPVAEGLMLGDGELTLDGEPAGSVDLATARAELQRIATGCRSAGEGSEACGVAAVLVRAAHPLTPALTRVLEDVAARAREEREAAAREALLLRNDSDTILEPGALWEVAGRVVRIEIETGTPVEPHADPACRVLIDGEVVFVDRPETPVREWARGGDCFVQHDPHGDDLVLRFGGLYGALVLLGWEDGRVVALSSGGWDNHEVGDWWTGGHAGARRVADAQAECRTSPEGGWSLLDVYHATEAERAECAELVVASRLAACEAEPDRFLELGGDLAPRATRAAGYAACASAYVLRGSFASAYDTDLRALRRIPGLSLAARRRIDARVAAEASARRCAASDSLPRARALLAGISEDFRVEREPCVSQVRTLEAAEAARARFEDRVRSLVAGSFRLGITRQAALRACYEIGRPSAEQFSGGNSLRCELLTMDLLGPVTPSAPTGLLIQFEGDSVAALYFLWGDPNVSLIGLRHDVAFRWLTEVLGPPTSHGVSGHVWSHPGSALVVQLRDVRHTGPRAGMGVFIGTPGR